MPYLSREVVKPRLYIYALCFPTFFTLVAATHKTTSPTSRTLHFADRASRPRVILTITMQLHTRWARLTGTKASTSARYFVSLVQQLCRPFTLQSIMLALVSLKIEDRLTPVDRADLRSDASGSHWRRCLGCHENHPPRRRPVHVVVLLQNNL